jgi:UDP-N-acetyl-D-galactosamine dehydrogenase
MGALVSRLQAREASVAVIGMGYVGLPLAAAFSRKCRVVGFDISERKIAELRDGHDSTGELTDDELAAADILFTTHPTDLDQSAIYLIAVPTPIDRHKTPDLGPVASACRTIAPHLGSGDIVVLESTVYPGVTEDVCGPLLEKGSGMRCGVDFFLGYSPERINPGDREHRVENIMKVVSGQTPEILEEVATVYEMVIEAGVHRAPTIKTAEAAKVIENTQRDLNIGLMNELAIIFDRLGIETSEVLAAAGTKWNFLPFRPGLVGGHCIGVDPYYLTYKAEELGINPQVIMAARRINDGMGKYVAEQTVKGLIKAGKTVQDSKVLILGLTFKEDVPDLRNSRVVDIIHELREYDVEVFVHDPRAEHEEARVEMGVEIAELGDLPPVDAIVLAVAHREYAALRADELRQLCGPGQAVFIDVKTTRDHRALEALGFGYWCL